MPGNERTSAAPAAAPAARRLAFGRRRAGGAKLPYALRCALSLFAPRAFFRAKRERLLASIASRPDRAEIEARAAWYCKPGPGETPLRPPAAPAGPRDPATMRVRDHRLPRKKHAYFFDSLEWLRYFPGDRLFSYWPGDKTRVPDVPSIVKSRPAADGNGRSVLLNMDKLRHFFFVERDIPFAEKDDVAVFRGTVRGKPKRIRLFERWFGAPGLDMGDSSKKPERPEWGVPEASVEEQLRHKFILCVEGNDVASNLKWVFSSNSVAVMPKPEFETWFQEGLLVPGMHYVEVKPDYSDLQEKLAWCRAHPAECERIAAAERAWVDRFRDPVREKLVSLLTLDRYFRATAPAGPSAAFLEKVFLDRREKTAALRGVEIFNLRLVRDLCALGVRVSLFAEPSWAETVAREVPDAPGLRVVPVRRRGPAVLSGLAAARALRRIARREGPFGTLLLGNVANRLVPALWLLRAGRDFRRMLLVAHRETSRRFLRAIRKLPGHVVAVSEPVAAGFRGKGLAADVVADYGVMDADRFFPPAEPRPADAPVRFCVLGALDNAWKGADTALAAFRLLPPAVRAKCELHLMAWRDPPSFPDDPGVTAYAWRDAAGVPDFLRGMDAMLVPSRDEEVMRETFSQTAVQGMLTGLPVVHSPIPVLAEKFDRGGGLCARTPDEFAAAMEKLAGDPALRAKLGAEARATALARYVWDSDRFLREHLLPEP